MENLNPWHVGSTTALTAATVNIVCAAAVFLFPEGTISFVNSWTHGLDFTLIKSAKPLTFEDLSHGLFNVTLTGFLVGALFACFYNLVRKCPWCH